MPIERTRQDPSADPDGPPTFVTDDTHWWDGSQVYGSTPEFAAALQEMLQMPLLHENAFIYAQFPGSDIEEADFLGELIGGTLVEIAREKAGIIKPGSSVVLAAQELPAAEVLMARCIETEAVAKLRALLADVTVDSKTDGQIVRAVFQNKNTF